MTPSMRKKTKVIRICNARGQCVNEAIKRSSVCVLDSGLEMEMAQEETKEAEEETKEVQFQFKKKQSERAINAIQSSYAYKKQQMNAEHWVELQVNDKNVRLSTCHWYRPIRIRDSLSLLRQSAAADSEFENLFSERDEDVVSDMTSAEYLAALRYRSKAKTVAPALAAVVEYVLAFRPSSMSCCDLTWFGFLQQHNR